MRRLYARLGKTWRWQWQVARAPTGGRRSQAALPPKARPRARGASTLTPLAAAPLLLPWLVVLAPALLALPPAFSAPPPAAAAAAAPAAWPLPLPLLTRLLIPLAELLAAHCDHFVGRQQPHPCPLCSERAARWPQAVVGRRAGGRQGEGGRLPGSQGQGLRPSSCLTRNRSDGAGSALILLPQ